jgi:hypothetical protein
MPTPNRRKVTLHDKQSTKHTTHNNKNKKINEHRKMISVDMMGTDRKI